MRKPAYLRPTAKAACSCGHWLVSRSDIGRPCWTCREPLVLVGEMPPAIEPLTAADRTEQDAGLRRARQALGAA